MRIWVTRTAPGNVSTASRLRELGHDVICAPVLRIQPYNAGPPDERPDAIVFTSSNGVRQHPLLPSLLDVPVFTVGRATAESARHAGYLNVQSADGDVRDLQRLILEQVPAPARLIHFGALEAARDLRGFLRRFGYLVERRTVYAAEVIAIRWLLAIRSKLNSIDGILIHSPRAAERVARVLAGTTWSGKVWCISEACALTLAGLHGVELHFSSTPEEAALINMVHESGIVRLPSRPARLAVWPLTGRSTRMVPAQPANDNGATRDRQGTVSDLDEDPPPAA